MSKKERPKEGPEILTPEEITRRMSEWADRVNADVVHNAKIHDRLLHEYAKLHGIDPRETGWAKRAAEAREKDARVGDRVTKGNPDGRPSGLPPGDELLKELRKEQAQSPKPMSDWKASKNVAERYDVTPRAVMKRTQPYRKPRM